MHESIPYNIWVYTMYGGTDFFFLLENKESKKLCKARFKLNLRNMHDTDNEGNTEWNLTIAPGEKIVKKLSTTNSKEKSGVKYSYAFKVEDAVTTE